MLIDRLFGTYLSPENFDAARIILSRGLGTVGHTGTFALDASNVWGDETSTLAGENLHEQVMS
ncbi:MAG: hypothetical protein ACHBN1_30560 [Heteroscytonema crispum UTEX LB 1556]